MPGSPSLGVLDALLVWGWWAPAWGIGPAGLLVHALGKYLDPAGDSIRCGPQNLAYRGTKISGDRPHGLAAQGVTSDLVIIIIIIIIRAFVRRTMSASELNLRRRQSLGGEDG